MTKTKKLALLAALTAVALTIFVAEAQIPPVVPVPGVKLGLANIVTLVTMALLGRREAGAVLVVRLILGSCLLYTSLGAVGGIAGSFALSFLVYEETGSTLAAALLIAINVIPGFIVPVVAAPFMDRLPRKPFLVGGDAVDGALYAAAGLYLLGHDFTYVGYLFFSLLLSSLSAFDSLAYQSIFPKLIPEGAEERGYTCLLYTSRCV